MELINVKKQLNINGEAIVATIGEFDGIHYGHMRLINTCVKLAKENNYKSAMIAFYPHPDYVLGKRDNEGYLTNDKEKVEILEKTGLDYVFILDFTKELLRLSKEQFYNDYLKDLKGLVIGYDYRFGFKGEGDSKYLKDRFENKLFEVIDKVEYLNEFNEYDKVGSDKIRAYLKNGDVERANSLLNYVYSVSGVVENGSKIGHSMGYPTANVGFSDDKFVPKYGVYSCKVILDDKEYLGICNIGINPSFNKQNKPRLEVNIFDLNEDIYSKNIKVELYHFVREETFFPSKEELSKQIDKDVEFTKKYFKK